MSRRLIRAACVAAVVAASQLVASPAQAADRPLFQMPFPCGEVWYASTYSGHNAIDWNLPGEDLGKPVVAAAAGTARTWQDAYGAYGVTVDHGGGWSTEYGHLTGYGVTGAVAQGQFIGYLGNSGRSTGPHLHWTQLYQGVRQNPLYADGSAIQPATSGIGPAYRSNNCGASSTAPGQIWEAASSTGWKALAMGDAAGPIKGSRVAAIGERGSKIVYTVRDGQVWEAGSAAGWRNLSTGVASGSGALAAILSFGGKVIYTIRDGQVWEAGSAAGWRNLSTGIAADGTALAAIAYGAGKIVYSVRGGSVWEAASSNGWRNLNTGIPADSNSGLAVLTADGVKYIYTVRGGYVWEAASNSGWRNLNTGIQADAGALSAIAIGGEKIVYSVRGGQVHEAGSSTGWRNLSSGVAGRSVAALALGTTKLIYAVN